MILVVNSGSSSIKFKLFNDENQKVSPIVEGLAERIGIDGFIKIEYQGTKHTYDNQLPNHEVAIKIILDQLIALKAIDNLAEITGVGFRVVHGGKISHSSIIDDQIYGEIKENVKLAPLHNPGALVAIDAVKKLIPETKMVACFDTAFHQTMPEINYLYSTPYNWYTDYEVRKYGFHGISYQYITQKMGSILNKPVTDLNLIVCHLGNGASITCVKNGQSYDTSMGLTPLAGLMMGTRSGDVDPSIVQYMIKQLDSDVNTVTDLLNKESGVKGVSGISADMRDVGDAYEENNPRAVLALEKYSQIVADFIVKYANYLNNKIDGIVFTAGIGENSTLVKKLIIEKVHLLNTELDSELNTFGFADYKLISTKSSQVPVYAVRTDEETMICLDTLKLISK